MLKNPQEHTRGVLLGIHVLTTWSSTQASVTLSSGEAEFYGVARASGIAMGQQSLMRDFGYEIPVRVWTDSTAAVGVCRRQGLGKLPHLDTQSLWVQEKVRRGIIELRKITGDTNPADLFSKHLPSRQKLEDRVRLFSCEYRSGRAASAPQLRRQDVNDNHDTMAQFDSDCFEDEARAHDPSVLPHHDAPHELDELFPRAKVESCAAQDLSCGQTVSARACCAVHFAWWRSCGSGPSVLLPCSVYPC